MLNHPIARLLAPVLTASLLAAPASAQPLLINEVDYDQIGQDFNEFIEILNISASPVTLSDYTLYLVNGATGAYGVVYKTLPLTGMLQPGQYLVICNLAVTPAPGALMMRFSETQTAATSLDNVQNGSPDGIALVNTVTTTMVDSLTYEGPMNNVTHIPGFPSVNLGHGTTLPLATADSNTVVKSLCRVPNGHASGDDVTDWALLDTPTPGSTNTPVTCTPDAPAIGPDPAKGCPGGSTTFTVSMAPGATQAPFVYTLRHNSQPVTDGRVTATPSADTLSCTLTFSGLLLTDAGSYDVSVTGICGAAVSTAAALFVAPADLGIQGGNAGQDGFYDNNDFIVFIDAFFNSLPSADVGKQGGSFGPDGLFDNNDFIVFIDLFFAGCPA